MAKNDLQGTVELLLLKMLSQHLQEAARDFEHLVKGVRVILNYA
jgi:hypothetical protein